MCRNNLTIRKEYIHEKTDARQHMCRMVFDAEPSKRYRKLKREKNISWMRPLVKKQNEALSILKNL